MTELLHLHAERRGVRPPLRGSREIQGNVLAAFNKDHQQFRFVRFTDGRLGRTWLAAMLGHISVTADVEDFNEAFSLGRAMFGADPQSLKATWTNLSLTPAGFAKLAVNPEAVERDLRVRDAELVQGAEARCAVNGDDPEEWRFGRDAQQIHAVVTLASDTEERLQAVDTLLDLLDDLLGVTKVYQENAGTLPGAHRGREHFGYKDGISQPGIRGFHEEDPDRKGHRFGHAGALLVNPGEFVFGYQTERGDEDGRTARWLRDGSIQVIRRLTQDVRGWEEAVEEHARVLGVTSDSMGAMLIGRHKDGRPLASPVDEAAGLGPDRNDFDYADDPRGLLTPCPAHVRKTNPRSFTFRNPRQRRILRRGIPFGPPYEQDPRAERGLLFVAHCTSIREQFEFQQRVWAGNPHFAGGEDGAPTGTDPVIGGAGEARFETSDVKATLTFERYVRTTGALYALVPSVSTLRLLAAGRELPR
ncbi:Dyp-type peroxidase family [Saccharothrix tamanrassetensis]|uniref:Dyp-type peroxidase family n=1 Tax=Saccharothrix tamanrassetensis TaxID=1051531 RepID=A0A841CSC9_9PSEU|nr:Dyp-type peroxidase [Saccharothrix tamanrassetensis]MBB5959234.1 Dyp-type peroxidase family [Saccharothrix tamanrassetensis]